MSDETLMTAEELLRLNLLDKRTEMSPSSQGGVFPRSNLGDIPVGPPT